MDEQLRVQVEQAAACVVVGSVSLDSSGRCHGGPHRVLSERGSAANHGGRGTQSTTPTQRHNVRSAMASGATDEQRHRRLPVLPAEILVHVARHLDTADALALAATNRRLHATLTGFVYARHIRYSTFSSAPLWHAVLSRDGDGLLELARRVLDAGADPNEPPPRRRHVAPGTLLADNESATLLLAAIRRGNTPLISLLLAAGANLFAHGQTARPPLAEAAHKGRLDIARLLVRSQDESNSATTARSSRRALLDQRGGDGRTALHHAAERGHGEMVDFLVSQGARVNARDLDGMTPLLGAVLRAHLAIVHALLEAGGDMLLASHDGLCALDLVAPIVPVEGGDHRLALLKTVIRAMGSQAPKSSVFQWLACAKNMVVEHLLAFGVDPNTTENGISVLGARACKLPNSQDIRAVGLLIDAGADVNHIEKHMGFTPLIFAATNNNIDVARLLLAHGASTAIRDFSGMSALAWATCKGDEDMVRLLLGHLERETPRPEATSSPQSATAIPEVPGSAVKEQLAWTDDQGLTPLMHCLNSSWPSEAIATLLLESGADAHATRPDGVSTMQLAIDTANVCFPRLLLDIGGVDLEEQDRNGATPLALAADMGELEILSYLLHRGAEVDVLWTPPLSGSERRITPLAQAIESNARGVMQMLLDHGADIDMAFDVHPRLPTLIKRRRVNKTTVDLLFGFMTEDQRAEVPPPQAKGDKKSGR
ncbi:ankyrin repeat-containing domain protein [Microdochium trichocladiopsis]|uniref:Ankyrin repeat-containing domain protein n=1 Tax=Microdochium trichocladiopsis TaxID=1682393 RepID=A0A9P8YGS7_9PEZI|nr:ankyrin repeat-containing domain protein [Microdochium trichocladiopsis]KAH7041432.1 ankyrin repeat-containing domain protein [Microdochium trichocladiopsis]